MAIDRRTVLKGGTAVGAAGLAGAGLLEFTGSGPDASRSADWGEQLTPTPYGDFTVHRVDGAGGAEFERIQSAVDVAQPRDLVLVEPGRYEETVVVRDEPGVAIRGTDRDEVIVDGGFAGPPCISITADDVVVENLTVRHGAYGVYWTGVEGYRASHVVAYNNTAPDVNGYGLYAFAARHGRFEHCYASGSDDAGIYIGESQPADAVITGCVAENNAMGFSGTNAGGNLVIRDSLWRHNMAGIVPNTLDSQRGAPQGHVAGGIRIEGNSVYRNNNLTAPAFPFAYPNFGNGITIAGGTRNDVVDNEVRDQAKYGIVVTPILDDRFYRPRANAVEANTVFGSGRADLALAAPAASNAFRDNAFGTSRPSLIERRDGTLGDPWVFLNLLKDYVQTEIGPHHSGTVEDQPAPAAEVLAELPSMDRPRDRPPAPPIGGWGR